MRVASILACCFLGALAASRPAAAPDPSASADPGNWRGFGRTDGEQHYSPLEEINGQTVKRLGLAWSLDLEPGNSVSGPVAVDGVVYTATGYSVLRAIDAVSGRELWRYDPHAAEVAGIRMRGNWGIRGLAYLDGRLFTGTVDGRLIAVDAKTGRVLWSVQTLEPGDRRFISGPPRAFAGKVVIGNGGGDSGQRGYLTCYDAATGKQLWRFWIVPGDPAKGFENPAMAMAAKTWTGEWWKGGGGGGPWNAFSYDAEQNLLFVGTGNGSPWNHRIRSPQGGDNLFLSSVLALNADTGAYVWHYQINPGDTWDYNASMDIQSATLTIGGVRREVVMQAPKNGFFYVLDRHTGRLISAEPIAKVTWASRIDLQTGRPVEAPNARFKDGPFELWPSGSGAHNWLPMAFSPQTGLVYIPVSERPMMVSDEGFKGVENGPNVGLGMNFDFHVDSPGARTSRLLAWNPATQRAVWSVPTPSFWGGGVMATAGGLVFQGRIDHRFNAYDAQTGKLLWSFDAGAPILAPPISYTAGGRQYVTVLTGWGVSASLFGDQLEQYRLGYNQARRVLTFRLDGAATLPPAPEWRPVTPPPDPDFSSDSALARRGAAIAGRCIVCHGANLIGAGHAPDLRGSRVALSAAAFKAIVKDGALVSRGMPAYPEFDDGDLNALRQFIRTRQHESRIGGPILAPASTQPETGG